MPIGSKSLRSSRLRLGHDGAGDPMESMGNLMDMMLVFACGLIVALVAHYNVDLNTAEVDQSRMTHLDSELTQSEQGAGEGVTNYAEVGMVYRDLDTGELYVVEQSDED